MAIALVLFGAVLAVTLMLFATFAQERWRAEHETRLALLETRTNAYRSGLFLAERLARRVGSVLLLVEPAGMKPDLSELAPDDIDEASAAIRTFGSPEVVEAIRDLTAKWNTFMRVSGGYLTWSEVNEAAAKMAEDSLYRHRPTPDDVESARSDFMAAVNALGETVRSDLIPER